MSRFNEDSLRMLRAIRFASVLEFSLEQETKAAITKHAGDVAHVSAERVAGELTRCLLESPKPSVAFRLLDDTGLLSFILPEVAAMIGVKQDIRFHPEGDVFTHTMLMLDAMQTPSLPLAYAVLLHDVGKPQTSSLRQETIHFYRHEETGASMARQILTRLRLATRDIETICTCIRNHMRLSQAEQMRTSKLRRLIGTDTFPLELELHRLDRKCASGNFASYDFLKATLESYQEEPVLPPPLITGRDLLTLGMSPGPQMGDLLRQAYDYQLEEDQPSRDTVLAWTRAQLP